MEGIGRFSNLHYQNFGSDVTNGIIFLKKTFDNFILTFTINTNHML